ncbi:MAG: terminase TerL endonuclease subunit [bacterium]
MTGKEAADIAVNFIKNELHHTKGRWYGKPFNLLKWQDREVVRPLFGTLKPNGYRQYKTVYVEMPKKGGKSELAAAIALKLFYADGEKGGEIYSAAADREQASIVFNVAVKMVEMNPLLLSKAKILNSTKRIIHRETGSVYKVVSAESYSKHGINASGIIFDELHAQPTRELYDTLTYGSGSARRQPLFFLITTAGYDRNSICWEVHEYARKIKEGIINDPTFLPVIYQAGDDDDWTDESVWRKVNPSLGEILDIDDLRDECTEAQENPAKENLFRRFRLNQWVRQEVRYIPLADWDRCGQETKLDDYLGKIFYAGLDLASSIDITAFVMCTYDEPTDKIVIFPYFWVPEDNVEERVRKDKVPYDVWIKQGLLFTTPGNMIDYEFIRKFINDLQDKVYIEEIAYDRWGMYELAPKLENDGFKIVPFGQGMQSMSHGTKELLSLSKSLKISHGGNPILRWMCDNVMVRIDAADNWKPDKAKSTERIDGMVALIMGLSRLLINKETDNRSVYDKEGLMIV